MNTKRMIGIAAGWITAAALGAGGTALADPGSPGSGYRAPQGQAQGPSQRPMHRQRYQQGQAKITSGEVVGLKSVRLRGTNQTNLVARIRTPDGRQQLVDLGPRSDARDLDLELGDRLRVQGTQAMVRGRPILIARQARSDGRQLVVDRSAQRRHFERAFQRAQECPRAAR